MRNYDLIILGGGAGAFAAANKANQLKKKTLLINDSKTLPLGGTCVNVGCIPSKMLIHAADVAEVIQNAHRFQILPKGYDIDFPTLVHRVSDEIDAESQSINPAIEANPNIDLYQDHGKFIGERTLKIGDEEITGDRVFISAGARPRIPNIKGLDGVPYITSTEALRLDEFPKTTRRLGNRKPRHRQTVSMRDPPKRRRRLQGRLGPALPAIRQFPPAPSPIA